MDSRDVSAVLNDLAGCEQPLLIGVRHHSAVMARVIPALMDEFRPDTVLIELPMEFAEWLDWLGHEELEAPVALAATSDTAGLSFYPFADFSPELAAVRWARQNGIPIEPCDLPFTDRQHVKRDPPTMEPTGLLDRLLRRTQSRDVGMLWERLVETPGIGADPQSIRRAGLLFGWALRSNDQAASLYDRLRESHMRRCIERASGRTAVVIGSYHASALLPEPLLWTTPDDPQDEDAQDESNSATALIPYSFEQLDERSGYPAGIRDPHWHQRVFAAAHVDDIHADAGDLIVSICRELRDAGHPINAADGKEVLRMAGDLATLRKLPAPGRGELIEAVQTCLTHGELFGLGRAVAKALERVLVGSRSGRLPDEVPRSGLAPHIESLLEKLNCPGPETLSAEPKRMRLDPMRSRLDRARSVTFQRLNACGISYAKDESGSDGSPRENLTEVWEVSWQHATAAMIELAAARGATLEQACQGQLVGDGFGMPLEDWTREHLALIQRAAICGMGPLVDSGLRWLMGPFVLLADLASLTQAMTLVERIRQAHIAGLPTDEESAWPPFVSTFSVPDEVQPAPLLQASIAQLEGLRGSESLPDAAAVLDLILWFQQQPGGGPQLEAGRLLWSLRLFRDEGSALMQGVGAAGLFLIESLSAEEFGTALGAWVSAATERDSRRQLRSRLQGAVLLAAPRLHGAAECVHGFEEQFARLADKEFLARLPALRGGFDVLSPAARSRLLSELLSRLPDEARGLPTRALTDDPVVAGFRAAADEAGRQALAELMPELTLDTTPLATVETADTRATFALVSADSQISLADRWRLILGQQPEQLQGTCRQAARALDELYGCGRGEGAGYGIGGGGGAGQEAPYPNVREWSGELEGLFGDDVREEVLGQALDAGKVAVLTELDADSVTPSMELLEQVLSMKGALPASQTEQLRKVARRIVDELARELATRLQPSLTGLSTPRPTSRPTPRLDLARTIRANLHTVKLEEGKPPVLAPERFIFRQPARRSMDWHITFVVDVSGSMEPSVIYSAMMAAIFSGLPAVSVQFLAFSTEVIDFTERVADPLEMLLEVQVGGGTHISKAVHAARERLRVPHRSIVLLVTDFDEGFAVGRLLAEVRSLVETGAKALGLAALNDDGQPRYNKRIAEQVAACGMPVAALSPTQLARWVGEQIR